MKTHIKIINIFAIGILGLILTSPFIAASPVVSPLDTNTDTRDGVKDTNKTQDSESDDDKDSVDNEKENVNERDVQVEVQEHQIQISSELKNGENKNKMELQIHSESDGLEIQLEFKSKSNNSESELKFKVQLYALYEFVDLNGNAVFDKSNDTLVKVYKLDKFAPAVYQPKLTESNSTIHYIKISTIDGVFTAHMFIVEQFEAINSTTVTPNELKLDVEIKNFNYTSNSSQLALYTKLETETEYKHEEDTEDELEGLASEEAAIETTVNNVTGSFSWAKTALVDNILKNVTTSSVQQDDEDEKKDKIYINYPRGTNIYHDPKIGVKGILIEPPPSTSSTPSFSFQNIPGYSPLLLGLIMVISFGFIIRKYKHHR